MISIWNKDRIRSARKEMDLTAKDAATALNVTPEYISMLENGQKQPSQKLILKMSILFKKPVKYFLEAEKNLVSA